MPAPSAGAISNALLYTTEYWASSNVTYSVPGAGALWSGYSAGEENTNADYGVFNLTQATRFREAVEAWDGLIAINLNEVPDASPGDIRIAFTDVGDFADAQTIAYAYSPGPAGGVVPPWAADIWITSDWKDGIFAPGLISYETMLHELGHTLGLKHPFEGNPTLAAAYDTTRYTLMSYTPSDDDYLTFITFSNGQAILDYDEVFVSTPMVFDVLAIQARYGADPNTAAGADSYTFDITTGFFKTIYDAAGADTFDLSTLSRGSVVDLTPGAYSSIGYWSWQDQAAYWAGQAPSLSRASIDAWFNDPYTYTWSNNLGIAYSTTIENLIGSGSADTVTGNAVANVLQGLAGDDRILGGDGDDSLAGGDGHDFLWAELGDDTIIGGIGNDYIHGNQGGDSAWGGLGNDSVLGGQGVDRVYGEDGDDIVYGNMGIDTVDGAAGNDTLRGGQDDDLMLGSDGNDWMSGDRGADTMSGGAGADIFSTWGDAAVDLVTDFNSALGDRVKFEVPTSYTVTYQGSDTVIQMVGGAQMILQGVTQATLGNWLLA
ncbi:MAG TPA: matrixin family metalloprotease [Phenylobacterium sp.]